MFSKKVPAAVVLMGAICLAGSVRAQETPGAMSYDAGSGAVNYGQYPQLGAPLYPSPVQYTPAYNGGTVITNQAFAPHEYLYPHTYHAMYPPFYYKVHGGWFWTPFGVRQHENWKLQGTEVTVKYRSHYPLFSGYHPPASH